MRAELTDADVRELLLAVGMDGDVDDTTLAMSFEDLHLDSLARMEIASRIQTRYGFDIESLITADSAPLDVKAIVNGRLAATIN